MLEPEKIRNKRFSTVKNGYDPLEVAQFLVNIADEVEALLAERDDIQQKIVKLVEKVNEYREDEDAINSAMIYAQKESNKLINKAKAEARDMIESAKTEQERLKEQNAEEIEKIKAEHQQTIDEYKEKCNQLIKEQTEATQQEILDIKAEYDEEKAHLEQLKYEVTSFKGELASLYTQQLALIMKMPQMTEEEVTAYEEAYGAEYYEDGEYYEDEPAEQEQQPAPVADEKTAEQKHIDEVLNTASFEPIIPKADSAELKFGRNTRQ